jgi:hypothetical protein
MKKNKLGSERRSLCGGEGDNSVNLTSLNSGRV